MLRAWRSLDLSQARSISLGLYHSVSTDRSVRICTDPQEPCKRTFSQIRLNRNLDRCPEGEIHMCVTKFEQDQPGHEDAHFQDHIIQPGKTVQQPDEPDNPSLGTKSHGKVMKVCSEEDKSLDSNQTCEEKEKGEHTLDLMSVSAMACDSPIPSCGAVPRPSLTESG